ncbi:hypothetical protein FACS1894133_6730 [Clostridia bacterium]|nr:hypothetical protein FACS1894133_6730 [Clostridia bacterium]
MQLGDKLEILIARKGFKKTEFASMLGITYRALANYLSGIRDPKPHILEQIAEELEVTPEFLLDENQSPVLTSVERFIWKATSENKYVDTCVSLIESASHVFRNKRMSKDDKRALFNILSEIYFAEINKLPEPKA